MSPLTTGLTAICPQAWAQDSLTLLPRLQALSRSPPLDISLPQGLTVAQRTRKAVCHPRSGVSREARKNHTAEDPRSTARMMLSGWPWQDIHFLCEKFMSKITDSRFAQEACSITQILPNFTSVRFLRLLDLMAHIITLTTNLHTLVHQAMDTTTVKRGNGVICRSNRQRS